MRVTLRFETIGHTADDCISAAVKRYNEATGEEVTELPESTLVEVRPDNESYSDNGVVRIELWRADVTITWHN